LILLRKLITRNCSQLLTQMSGRLRSIVAVLTLALFLTLVHAADRVDFGPYRLDSNTAKLTSIKQVVS